MRPEELETWRRIGAALSAINAALHAPAPSWADRLRPLIESLPYSLRQETEPQGAHLRGDQSPVGDPVPPPTHRSNEEVTSEPSGQTEANKPQLPVQGKAVSLFAVDPSKVTAGDFFRGLTFQRNDPGREAQVVFEKPKAEKEIWTCRQFFAYSIPWDERGGVVQGPKDHEVLDSTGTFTSLNDLSAAATAQALHLAAKLKRKKDLTMAYTSPSDEHSVGSVSRFFSAVPWSARRPHIKQQSIMGLTS